MLWMSTLDSLMIHICKCKIQDTRYGLSKRALWLVLGSALIWNYKACYIFLRVWTYATFATSLENIRDAIPFPKYPRRVELWTLQVQLHFCFNLHKIYRRKVILWLNGQSYIHNLKLRVSETISDLGSFPIMLG